MQVKAKFDKKLKKKEKQLKAMRLRDIRPLRAQELMEEEKAAQKGEVVVRVTKVLDEAEAEKERKYGTIHGAPRTVAGESERGAADMEAAGYDDEDMETTTSMMGASTLDGEGGGDESARDVRRRRVRAPRVCVAIDAAGGGRA